MPIRDNREYRLINQTLTSQQEDNKYIVEGYATTFNEPYILFSSDGVDYSEQIDARAFDEADMSDVIFQLNHEGMVFARNKNGTLTFAPDEHGLHIRADLSLTEASRQIHEAIDTGLIDQMSFAFTVADDAYDKEKHLRTIKRIKKVYDVSAVSIPANPNTSIYARSAAFDGFIEAEKTERLETERKEKQKQRIRILSEVQI